MLPGRIVRLFVSKVTVLSGLQRFFLVRPKYLRRAPARLGDPPFWAAQMNGFIRVRPIELRKYLENFSHDLDLVWFRRIIFLDWILIAANSP
jgi:hypothetical protein